MGQLSTLPAWLSVLVIGSIMIMVYATQELARSYDKKVPGGRKVVVFWSLLALAGLDLAGAIHLTTDALPGAAVDLATLVLTSGGLHGLLKTDDKYLLFLPKIKPG